MGCPAPGSASARLPLAVTMVSRGGASGPTSGRAAPASWLRGTPRASALAREARGGPRSRCSFGSTPGPPAGQPIFTFRRPTRAHPGPSVPARLPASAASRAGRTAAPNGQAGAAAPYVVVTTLPVTPLTHPAATGEPLSSVPALTLAAAAAHRSPGHAPARAVPSSTTARQPPPAFSGAGPSPATYGLMPPAGPSPRAPQGRSRVRRPGSDPAVAVTSFARVGSRHRLATRGQNLSALGTLELTGILVNTDGSSPRVPPHRSARSPGPPPPAFPRARVRVAQMNTPAMTRCGAVENASTFRRLNPTARAHFYGKANGGCA